MLTTLAENITYILSLIDQLFRENISELSEVDFGTPQNAPRSSLRVFQEQCPVSPESYSLMFGAANQFSLEGQKYNKALGHNWGQK